MARPDKTRPRRSPAAIGALTLTLVVTLVVGALAVDAAVTAATSPERRTTVVEASPGVRDAETYDPRFAVVFLNGLGLDISGRQALALAPSVGRYGRVLALEYASVFDPDEAADALHDILAPPGDGRTPVYLGLVASSMGDVRGLEIIASLQQRHPDVRVVGFVVNTGPGPGKRTRVRGGRTVQALLDQSCWLVAPGRVTLGLLEVLNQNSQGHVNSTRDVALAYRSGTSYRGRVIVNQLCSLTRASALEEPPRMPYSVYLTTGDPADDVMVDTEGAYADWREVLPGMELIRVPGATHDNLSYRPDLFNPLFADVILPRLRAEQVARTPRSHQPGLGANRPV